MALSLKMPPEAYSSLAALATYGPEKLRQLDATAANRELTLDIASLAKALAKVVEYKEADLERIIRDVFIPLNILRAAYDLNAEDFVAQFDSTLVAENPEWYSKNKQGWLAIRPAFVPFVAPGGYFSHLRKAFQLLANRPLAVRNVKILAELRPVYDDALTATKAMLLSSTLVLDYEDSGGYRTLHLALDQIALDSLREQIQRVEKKFELMEKQAEQFGVPVLVDGTER